LQVFFPQNRWFFESPQFLMWFSFELPLDDLPSGKHTKRY
jgi:hypothetical protein